MNLKDAKRIVVKIGTMVLSDLDRGGFDHIAFANLATQIADAYKEGRELVVVSSGAILAGKLRLERFDRTQGIKAKQALAAIGQVDLMNLWSRYLGDRGIHVAQILLTGGVMADRERFVNARNALFYLIEHRVVPIINENDTVVVEEIKLGDNDNLSALTANLVEADLLVILTDQEGVYDQDPTSHPEAKLLTSITDIDSRLGEMKNGGTSRHGTGGMRTKLLAAKSAADFGIPTVIAKGKRPGVLTSILEGQPMGTLITPHVDRLSSWKHWIAHHRPPKGAFHVDQGAARAIIENCGSLLPAGIRKVEGQFVKGDPVVCKDPDGKEIAVGLVAYDSVESEKIMGLHTDKIETVLGYKYCDEVIHRNNLVLLG